MARFADLFRAPQYRSYIGSMDAKLDPLYQFATNTENMLTAGVGLATGDVYYVDSNVANAGDGTSWDRAKATLNAAVALCTADNGDVIMVAPGHAETISSAALSPTLSVTGVTVLCCGNGTLAPTFTITHVDGTISITGANCRLSGARIVSNVADVKVGLTLGALADGSVVDHCVFRDSAANKEFLVGISVTAACDNAKILYNNFQTTAAAGTNNAILTAAVTDLEIVGNVAFGKFATGALLGSAALTGATITDNIFINAEAAIAIALNTSSTGVLARNFLGGTTSIAAALTGDNAMWCFENYVSGAAAVSGILNPAGDAD